jgi:ATP-dependent DNA helicase RecG
VAYDDAALTGLLADLESDLVERKQSANDADRIREAICAYANDMPDHRRAGVIFIGVDDDGSCCNLPVTDDLLLRLAHMRDDAAIQPFPSIVVDKKTLAGCTLAVVQVEPSGTVPVRFKGRTQIRVGPRRALATPDDERRLVERMRGRALPFDVTPLSHASVAELDLERFRTSYLPEAIAPEVLEQNNRPEEDQLKALRFLSPHGCPTVLGVLVLAHDPRAHVYGAYVQFVRFDGREVTDPIRDQAEIGGPLSQMMDALDDKLKAHNQVHATITEGDLEVRRPEYPIAALQQLVRNAVMHRTYEGTNAPVRVSWFDDRIEVQSPGGPFGQVTPDNFATGLTDYRNPNLAEAMKNLGYVQRFGVGFEIVRKELGKNGNPPMEHEVATTHVLVRVRRGP